MRLVTELVGCEATAHTQRSSGHGNGFGKSVDEKGRTPVHERTRQGEEGQRPHGKTPPPNLLLRLSYLSSGALMSMNPDDKSLVNDWPLFTEPFAGGWPPTRRFFFFFLLLFFCVKAFLCRPLHALQRKQRHQFTKKVKSMDKYNLTLISVLRRAHTHYTLYVGQEKDRDTVVRRILLHNVLRSHADAGLAELPLRIWAGGDDAWYECEEERHTVSATRESQQAARGI